MSWLKKTLVTRYLLTEESILDEDASIKAAYACLRPLALPYNYYRCCVCMCVCVLCNYVARNCLRVLGQSIAKKQCVALLLPS